MIGSNTLLILALIAIHTHSEPSEDRLDKIPGYPPSFSNRAFAGYLHTQSDLRQLHYVFLEGNKGVNNSAPVLLWLNGGPGCTSLLGLIMEIGPYTLTQSQTYQAEDDLTFNPFSWINVTNLLFIDSPAGAGYSINQDSGYVLNDANTQRDTLSALTDFFTRKFPQYAQNTFYIAGEAYAGKFIPDLSLKILTDSTLKINLKGILIGNPTINFLDLQKNRVQWMMSHNLVDPQLMPYWQRSCQNDVDSAGCQYFYERYEDLTYRINQFNIYGQCYGRTGPRQTAIIEDIAIKMSPFHQKSRQYLRSGGQWCSYDAALQNYLNVNAVQLKSVKTEGITVCNMSLYAQYKIDPKGSINELPSILKRGLKVYLYTGDWDDVVPFIDTYKNIDKMNLKLLGGLTPWIINDQHAGFIRNYSYNLTVYQVKGAGQQVPLYQKERAFKMLQKFVYA